MPKPELPISEIEQQLLECLTTHRRLVLSAPTGSGKSTQVPQMLLNSGLLRDGQVTGVTAAPVANPYARRLGGSNSRR